MTEKKKGLSVWVWLLIGCGGIALLAVVVLVVVVPTLILPNVMERMDRLQALMAVQLEVQANPEVTELLGRPVGTIDAFDERPGSFEVTEDLERVSARVIVKGSKDSAIVQFDGTRGDDGWVPERMVLLTEDGTTINLLQDGYEPGD